MLYIGYINDIVFRYTHEGVRFPCDSCNYKATTSSNLTQHKLKCAALLINQFKEKGLLEESCGHCQKADYFSLDSLHVDKPGGLVTMKCTGCSWKTVRRFRVEKRLL